MSVAGVLDTRPAARGPVGTRLRTRTAVAGLAFVLAATAGGLVLARSFPRTAEVGLASSTVAVGPGGVLVGVGGAAGAGPGVAPGSRVLLGQPDTDRLVAEESAWLAAGRVPVVAALGDSTMVRDALLDLRTLSLPYGVPVAAWTGPWRYVWPRDSALAAVALARTGHAADAERVVAFLQQVQPASGVFQARYAPDGSGAVPDDRGVQLDGAGWSLWALAEVADTLDPAARADFLARHRTLLDRSTGAAVAATREGLPPASADYWEVRESRTTLATAALLLAGLEAAARLEPEVGAEPRAAAAASRLSAAITTGFGPDGYPRRLGGRASSVDLGVAFLLPPFAPRVDPDVHAVFVAAPARMMRPAGGLAPGGSWRQNGVSWTTSTSIVALTAAASGDTDDAVGWLRWLDAHRTPDGSLPEKVLADGRPAEVAPLAWTAAAVILAADELERR